MRLKYFIKDAECIEPLYYNEKTMSFMGLDEATGFNEKNFAINCMYRNELVNTTVVEILIDDFDLVDVKSATESYEMEN